MTTHAIMRRVRFAFGEQYITEYVAFQVDVKMTFTSVKVEPTVLIEIW